MVKRRVGLYVHIPFCVKKCSYCDFLSFVGCSDERKAGYMNAVRTELLAWKKTQTASFEVFSIFIGGGTPSSLDPSHLDAFLNLAAREFSFCSDAEVTVEVNPGTVSQDAFRVYRQCGINRVSFGVQSLDPAVLRFLGRIHTPEDFYRAREQAAQAGFRNLNADLILGVPGQSVASYLDSLKQFIFLDIPHISAYSLIVEPGTPLYEGIRQGAVPEPDDELDRLMYWEGQALLRHHGYVQDELSNFSLPGWECRHNLLYWTCQDYIGIGLGASSYLSVSEQKSCLRLKNPSGMEQYLSLAERGFPEEKDRWEEVVRLTEEEQKKEFMMLGFRLSAGPDSEEYTRRFHESPEDRFGDILCQLERRGLVQRIGNRWKLSLLGQDFANQVFLEFL